jgi:tryptophanyl-tRNA synthetase
MRILTAVQPTNQLTIGNYLGSIKEVVDFQNQGHEIILFIADLHSITLNYDPKQLKENVLTTLATYLACGIDPLKTTIFLQSQLSEHSELKHLLSPFVSYGDLTRMTQFKDKQESQKFIPLSLLDYPVLMAADVLLYKPDIVPVGLDQKQHLELMRSIASRFNDKHTFFNEIKDHYSVTPKIMSLQDPLKKMSKSDPNTNGTIFLMDSEEIIIKKFKKAVTDTDPTITYNNSRPGLKNILDLYSSFSNIPIDQIIQNYSTNEFGRLKIDTANVVNNKLTPIRNKIEHYLSNKDELNNILKKGKQSAQKIASKNLKEIKELMGFICE